MLWGEIGAVLLVLATLFIAGHLWFHIVEGVLAGLKRLVFSRQQPPAWHPLPPDGDDAPKKEP